MTDKQHDNVPLSCAWSPIPPVKQNQHIHIIVHHFVRLFNLTIFTPNK